MRVRGCQCLLLFAAAACGDSFLHALPATVLLDCGDGKIDGGEECDDATLNNDRLPDHCRTDCRNPRCGDGVVDLGEECDDGNPIDDDGCNSVCGTWLWSASHDGGQRGADTGVGVAVDGDGSVVVSGTITVIGTDKDAWLRKYDPRGEVSWTRTVNGSANAYDTAYSVAVDGGSNVVAGGVVSDVEYPFDPRLWKYDADGELSWEISGWVDGLDGFVVVVAIDSHDRILAAGSVTRSRDLYFVTSDIWVGKWAEDGTLSWLVEFDSGVDGEWRYGDQAHDLVVDAQDNVYVTGMFMMEHGGEPWTVKLDSNGVEQWRQTHVEGEGECHAGGHKLTLARGRLVLLGYACPGGRPQWIREYDASDGTVLANHGYDFFGLPLGNQALSSTADGNYLLAGSVETEEHGNDLWVGEYTPDGTLVWERRHDGPAGESEELLGLAVAGNGNVVVGGYEAVTSWDTDIWVREYMR